MASPRLLRSLFGLSIEADLKKQKLFRESAADQCDSGIATAAGSDSAGLPNTVHSMIPNGVVRGQSVNVNRTKRHLTGGISSKIVFREIVFFV